MNKKIDFFIIAEGFCQSFGEKSCSFATRRKKDGKTKREFTGIKGMEGILKEGGQNLQD
jgi:hypothetical protein